MGIYDRDYARPQPPPGLFARRRWYLFGLSITVWLIAINTAVFVFDALVAPKWAVESTAGEAYAGGLPSLAERRTFKYARDQSVQLPDGYLGHPILRTDANGNVALNPDGSPAIVGFERYTMMPPLKSVGHFSTGKGFRELQVWRLVFFQFLHADINHLLLNMLGLYFFGPVVERALGGGRRYLAFYLMCGICGALFYLLLNLLGSGLGMQLRGVLVNDIYTPLIGASAGCFGVLVATAVVAGDATMYFFGIIPMKVRTGAIIMVALAAGNLIYGGSNAGGDAAHIGGAIAGFYFIKRPYLLREFFDFFGKGRTRIKPAPARAGGKRPGPEGVTAGEKRRVDELLDRVREKGIQSLSESERAFLQAMSERL